MAQETFSQHVPGAQGLKGPPVCIIMSGSANANVTVALLQNSSWLITPLRNQNDFLETESWNKAVSFVKQLLVQASWHSSRTGWSSGRRSLSTSSFWQTGSSQLYKICPSSWRHLKDSNHHQSKRGILCHLATAHAVEKPAMRSSHCLSPRGGSHSCWWHQSHHGCPFRWCPSQTKPCSWHPSEGLFDTDIPALSPSEEEDIPRLLKITSVLVVEDLSVKGSGSGSGTSWPQGTSRRGLARGGRRGCCRGSGHSLLLDLDRKGSAQIPSNLSSAVAPEGIRRPTKAPGTWTCPYPQFNPLRYQWSGVTGNPIRGT